MGGTSRDTPESRSAPGELDDDMATVSIDEEMPADFTKAAASASSFAPSQPLPLEKKGAADFAPSQEEMEKLFPDLEILNLLGAGGMGAVFKARQKRLDRLVALKVLSCPPEMHESFSLRFEREAQLLAKLLHPNIVTIFDFGEIRENGPGGLPLFYFIMEYVDGSDLAKRIRAGTISIKETLSIIPQICDALQVAHDLGITHRDVKPANMLLDSQGQVRVADFGVAKIVDNEDDLMTGLTLTGTTMGTPHYMAPEQWDAPEKVDHRSDIYSLGVIFYQMLTGERPVGRFLPPSQKVTVDPRIDEVVFKALETKRRDRYQRASEMAGEVREIAATQAANSRGGKGKAIALVLATAAAAALLTAAFRGLTNKNNGGGESIERAASVSHPQNDKNESFPAPHGSITPGRLRAAGRDTSGKPFDISEATPFNDFIDVVSQGYTWIALRKNGQTVSSDPQLIRSGITDLIWEEGSSPAFLSKDGSVEIFEQSPGLKGSTLPLSFEKTGVAQFAMGLGHGIALLRNGEVSIRGPRYERALVKGEVPDTYESGIWPPPPSNDLKNAVSVAATTTHAAALRKDGSLIAWGHSGIIDPEVYNQIHPIKTIKGSGDSFYLLTESNRIFRLRVPRSTDPNSPTGTEVRLEFVSTGTSISSTFYLSSNGAWKAFSQTENSGELLFNLPPKADLVACGHTIIKEGAPQSWLLWIEPSASPVPGSPLTSREVDLPPALAAMKERGGRLRQWQNKSANPIDISAAENVNNFIRLTGTPLPDKSRWVAIANSGSTISALTNFDRSGEIVALGTHNAVLNDGTLLRCWEMQRDLIPGDYLGAGYVGSSKIQFDLLLRRDGKLEMNRGPVGLSSSEWKSDELPLIRAKVAKIDDAVSINCGPNTASILRADGSVVAWLPDIGELHADPPIEKAVEIANGSNLCGALLEDGTVRVLQPPSIHPSLAKALRPPADLGKAYALRVNGRVCAAQMADGTWRAWGSDAPDLIVQINNLGPAVDILFYADKKAAAQRSLLWIEPANSEEATALSPPGKLNAMGTYEDGTPIDLSKAEGINDFVKVVLQRTGWMGIRKNGTTISSGGIGERENIVDIYPAGHVSFTVKSSDRSLEILSSYDELEPKLNAEIPEEIHKQKVIDYFGLIKHYICLLEDRSVRVWGDYYDHPERLPEWANPESAWPRPPAEAAENVISIGGGVTFAGTVTADGKLWLWDHEGMTDLGEFKKLQGDFVSLGKSTHHGTDALLNDGRILQINRKTGRFSLLENHNLPSGTANSGYRPLYQNSEGEWYTTWPTKGIEPFLETLKSRPPEEFSMNTSFIEYGPDGEKVSIGLITIDPPHAEDELSEDKANPHLGKTAGEERLFEVSPGVEIPFLWCPPGEFTMGSPEKEIGRQPDEMQHKVKLSKGYWLAKTEFTVGDWLKIPGNSPRRSQGLDPLNPITHVSWEMIAGKNGFLERIAGSAPEGWHFDLPTEAQWEYACRAGTSTMYFWETTNAKPENYKHHLYANLADVNSNKDWAMKMIDDGYGNEPAPVGTYLPNPWGFLDIVGNVNELCRDWIAAYEKDSLIDPVGPASGEEKVTRGGSYINGWADLRSATRTSIKPDFAGSPHTGFRLVLQED
ncbi:bifunctional serine/threonine-protein kinase/formylglycine-generating enzyme family protein [Verrucomicrobiales bacterium BCK34]|nr:bifunctional serine/threonine-protein kinase/formylglycine-generating enzyme family protein [Verrucomicrobiales bacterium BCK34]